MKLRLLKKTFIIAIIFLLMTYVFGDTVYSVKKGDTLYSISKKYELTVAELRAANNLSEKDVLKAGQNLVIPDADISTAAALSSKKVPGNSNLTNTDRDETVEYVVQKGETLYGIARKNGLTVAELMNINNLDSNDVLKAGQKLKVKVIKTENKENTNKKQQYKESDTGTNKPSSKNQTQLEKNDDVSDEKIVIPPKAPDTRKYGDVITYDSKITWPVSNPVVTQVKGKISGVQLSALPKETVKCVHEGTVMFVGTYRGFGQVLFVQSKTGLIYAYTGLGSISVKKGEYVVSGDKLGTVGVDSLTGKPQITFMVFQNGNPIDPAKAPRS